MVADAALAALLLVGAVAQVAAGVAVAPEVRGPDEVSLGMAACAAVSLAWRRVAPVGVLAVQVVVGIAVMAAGVEYGTTWAEIIGFVVALYSVAAYRGLARGGVAGGIAIGYAAIDMAVDLPRPAPATIAINTAFLIGSWVFGRTVRLRRAYLAELTARAERLERAREADARVARAEERSRIARELHDVVAHHVSVMTVQAGAARRILDRDPAKATEALSNIERMGRTALGEMRRIVGVLRVGGDDGAPEGERAPQPGLADVEALIARLREAGLAVTVRTEGTPRPLSPGVDLAAYRLIQEALTNVLKHAGRDVRAQVVLEYGRHRLTVTVRDDGAGGGVGAGAARRPAAGSDPRHGQGHGLVGMRERVALYGGDLRVGPRPGGGFEVHARFPLEVE